MPPTTKRYRRITPQDNFLTTGRTDNPLGAFIPVAGLGNQFNPSPSPRGPFQVPQVAGLGTYKPPMSNPSTAIDGQFGAPYGNAPVGVPNNTFKGNNFQPVTAGQAFTAQRLGEQFTAPNNTLRTSQRTSGNQGYGSYKISQAVGNGQIPVNITPGDIRAFQERGLDVGQLVNSGLVSYNASSGNYVITPAGLEANKNAAPGGAGSGSMRTQTVNGVVLSVDEKGRRMNSSGQVVWDPQTATQDVYGGNFIQVGEVRWERNKKGKLVKVQYQGGGKKKVVSGGAGQSKEAKNKPAVQNDGYTVSNSFINFNTSSG